MDANGAGYMGDGLGSNGRRGALRFIQSGLFRDPFEQLGPDGPEHCQTVGMKRSLLQLLGGYLCS